MTIDDVINYGDSLLAIGTTHGLPLRARIVGGAADALRRRGIEAGLVAGRCAPASAPACRARRRDVRHAEMHAVISSDQPRSKGETS